MPDIQKAYKEYLYNKAFSNNTINNIVPNDQDLENNTTTENITNEVIYDFNSDNKIEINELSF